ncbi:MAG TPA: sugar phosphate isomerase/epimerase [Flavitalea sp.]|nr:sugar phosphate isomerase/epimerase [Flavitalea sp.]
MNRRKFIQQGAFAAGAAAMLAQLPQQLFAGASAADIPVGFQSWILREEIGKNFAGLLKMMADQGYKLVEMCSPKGYGGGFAPLENMKPSEMRKIINDAGLTCPSCHFGFGELNNDLDSRIEWSKELGLTHIVCSSFGLPKTATIDDWMAAADKLNAAGEKIKKAGLQTGFHNHSVELTKIDDKLIYDELLKRFDKELVKLQFQTEVINLGYKGADYFNKYPGRFFSTHLSDWTADKKEAVIGQGVIDWKEFFAAAKKAGVKYYYVEMEADKFKDSISYINSL